MSSRDLSKLTDIVTEFVDERSLIDLKTCDVASKLAAIRRIGELRKVCSKGGWVLGVAQTENAAEINEKRTVNSKDTTN